MEHVEAPPAHALAPSPSAVEQRVRAMFDAHYGLVWRSLRRFGVHPDGVDDAAQKVFLVAVRKLGEIEVGQEARFLVGVAVRVASEDRRHAARRREVSGEAALEGAADRAPGPEDVLHRRQLRAIVDAVLDAMPFELRTVFALVELEGMSAPEVAGLLEIPLGTVSSRLRRAREAFSLHAKRLRLRRLDGPLQEDVR